jgi:hypothetical protein
MVQIFNLVKGRGRYSFANVHDDKVLDRIKELYPIMYGKSSVPKSKLLGKEFAKGIVAEMVKGILVNWANFGHETNTNQQGKWQSKLDTLIANEALVFGLNMWEVKKELKVLDIVKVEKGVKVESEPLKPTSIGKVGEINPWIQ